MDTLDNVVTIPKFDPNTPHIIPSPKLPKLGVAGRNSKDFVIVEHLGPGVSLYAVVSGH